MVDMDDRYSNRRPYREYEMTREQRSSLDEIERACKRGYEDEDDVRSHINYLEHLQKSLRDIMANEHDHGYDNQTLKHDYERVERLMKRCHEELHILDAND